MRILKNKLKARQKKKTRKQAILPLKRKVTSLQAHNCVLSVAGYCVPCAQSCSALAALWTAAHQAPLFMRFSR